MRVVVVVVCLGVGLLPLTLCAQEKDGFPTLPVAVEAKLKNPWPDDWEKEFRQRGEAVLKAQCAKEKAAGLGGRTYFENEKRAYGTLMAHLVVGDRAVAIKELQREDAQAESWHKHTRGIDYYASFTLKHQMRKYFLFGTMLQPEYKARMYDGAKLWTEKDPLRRPHPAFVKSGEGWGPDVRNSWVDVRNTENLFLMRVTSVYLMAEETKNEGTRKQYKETLLKYAQSLYRVGMGEWDSENYHGHSLSPLLNLYDFAQDMEIKAAAKACLDYICAIGAVKYYRGAFNGPTNRDYNHPQPFGGSAACMLWLYFGDTPLENHQFESDEVHVLTSGYRPPAAVVHLARKQFARPHEILASKPAYTASTTADWKSPPEYFETHYFGRTFQMGSLVGGTTVGKSAVNGFKITVTDDKAGALAIQGVPGPDPLFVGSARYVEGKVAGPNRVAQNKTAALWLVEGGEAPWVWTLPDTIRVEEEKGVAFLRSQQTWVALRPINLSSVVVDKELTRKLAELPKKEGSWAGHQVLSARGKGGKFCGVIVEVGEVPDQRDYAAFKQAVLSRSQVDSSALNDGMLTYTSIGGQKLALKFAATVQATEVTRDGKKCDWTAHAKFLYRPADSGNVVIEQEWLSGKLQIRAGKATFTCEVNERGAVSFRNE